MRYGNGPDQDFKGPLARTNWVVVRWDERQNRTSTSIPFPFLARHDGYAWTAPVGKFLPNDFELFDMHGNVLEWCSDWYDERYYEYSTVTDPQGPRAGTSRVVRGGGFDYAPVTMRCAYRIGVEPRVRHCNRGFRVVCEQ